MFPVFKCNNNHVRLSVPDVYLTVLIEQVHYRVWLMFRGDKSEKYKRMCTVMLSSFVKYFICEATVFIRLLPCS